MKAWLASGLLLLASPAWAATASSAALLTPRLFDMLLVAASAWFLGRWRWWAPFATLAIGVLQGYAIWLSYHDDVFRTEMTAKSPSYFLWQGLAITALLLGPTVYALWLKGRKS
jgi:hypothetical protein